MEGESTGGWTLLLSDSERRPMLDIYLRNGRTFLAVKLFLPAHENGVGVVFSHGWGGARLRELLSLLPLPAILDEGRAAL